MALPVLSQAKNIGNYGALFPVIEVDVRTVILDKLKAMENTGELKKHQEIVTTRMTQNVIRPTALHLMPIAHTTIKHIDPSIMVNQDITTPDGQILAKKGSRINPFSEMHYTKTLFFFNGDDPKQVAWAKAHYQEYGFVKFILTGGSIKEGAEHFGRIYFDQGGALTTQLHVTHVPAVVEQDGLFWKVSEIGLQDA
jgi:conjugal transfer pilus assembly protein TraW